MRWVVGLGVVCAVAWGCDDPEGASGGQDEGAKASNEKADEAPTQTTVATNGGTDGAAPDAKAAKSGEKVIPTGEPLETAPDAPPSAPPVAVDLGIEKSTLTVKIGDEEPTTHELTRDDNEVWTWTADASRNLLFYNDVNNKTPGELASVVINLNRPGEKLELGKVGTGAQAAIYIVLNEKNPTFVGSQRSIHAVEGSITAERDPVSGAMKGTFEGSFKSEPNYKPLVTGPEHEPVKVKMSGSFAVQPPPREEVEKPRPGRTQVVMPNMNP